MEKVEDECKILPINDFEIVCTLIMFMHSAKSNSEFMVFPITETCVSCTVTGAKKYLLPCLVVVMSEKFSKGNEVRIRWVIAIFYVSGIMSRRYHW